MDLSTTSPAKGSSGSAAPGGDLREHAGEIWCDLLGYDEIEDDDNFFELGGFSILAMQVVTNVRDRLGIGINLAFVLNRPTFSEFVAGLAARAAEPDPGSSVDSLPQHPVDGLHPVTAQQRSMLELLAGPGRGLHYDLAWTFDIDGVIDPDMLTQALRHACRVQPALRTRLTKVDGDYMQHVLPVEDASWNRTEHATPDVLGVLDTDLFGVRLDGPSGSQQITLRASHIIFDGWSLDVLLRTIEACYERSDTAVVPDPGLAYTDYARWQQDQAASGVLAPSYAWWEAQLAGYRGPAPWLPALRAVDMPPSFAADTTHSMVSADVAAAVRTTAQAVGSSPFHLLLAAFAVLLRAAKVGTDLVVGSSTASRHLPSLTGTIGYFANGRLTRFPAACGTVSDLVEHCRSFWTASNSHAEVHMEQLVDRSGNPDYFDVKFSLQDAPGFAAPSVRLGNAMATMTATLPPRTVRRAFDVSATPSHDGHIDIWAIYRPDVLTPRAAAALCATYAGVLALVLANPGARLDTLIPSVRRLILENS